MGQYTKKVVQGGRREDHSTKGMMTSTLRCYFVFLVIILDAVLFNATQVPNFSSSMASSSATFQKRSRRSCWRVSSRSVRVSGDTKGTWCPARTQQVLLQDFGGKQ